MIKKLILMLCAVLALGTAKAQTVGTWQIYPLFDGVGQYIAEGNNKVYYISAHRLFSYDKDTHEYYSYSTQNKLSDSNITLARYNPRGQYLLVAYDTGNIDIIYDNGRSVNCPEIKDATLTTTKGINDCVFHQGRVYLATDFGLVVYDEKTWNVAESGIYNKKLSYITIINGHITVYPHDDYNLYRSALDKRHNTWEAFERYAGSFPGGLFTLDDVSLYYTHGETGELYLIKYLWDIMDWNVTPTGITPTATPRVQGGKLLVQTADALVELDNQAQKTLEIPLPDALKGKTLTYSADPTSLWALHNAGLSNYSLDPQGNLTTLLDAGAPDASTTEQVAVMKITPDGNRLYMQNLGMTLEGTCFGPGQGPDLNYWIAQRTGCLANGKFEDWTMRNYTHVNMKYGEMYQGVFNNKEMYGGTQALAIDPEDPTRIFIAQCGEGLLVLKEGKIEHLFDASNSLLNNEWLGGPRMVDVNFDADGNLWAGQWTSKNTSAYVILPRTKVQGDLKAVTKDDWIYSKHSTLDNTHQEQRGWYDQRSVFLTKHPGYGVTLNYNAFGSLVFYDTGRTATSNNSHRAIALKDLVDQDGRTYSPWRWTCLAEDLRGRVWVGSNEGVIEITDPTQAWNAGMRINHLKVPRNDGTNTADYLLGTEKINCIAVDPINRKWIATEGSGVYLVSENGDEILEHFTPENSPLPSNAVHSVVCHPNGSQVFFGCAMGLLSYTSNATAGADDYQEIYAYPNPVRPDYFGPVTVTGLMDQSLVKIADTAGNVVAQGQSTGGMFVWDVCNSAGQRVPSGVYFVLASQNATGNNMGAVTKIVVIN